MHQASTMTVAVVPLPVSVSLTHTVSLAVIARAITMLLSAIMPTTIIENESDVAQFLNILFYFLRSIFAWQTFRTLICRQ